MVPRNSFSLSHAGAQGFVSRLRASLWCRLRSMLRKIICRISWMKKEMAQGLRRSHPHSGEYVSSSVGNARFRTQRPGNPQGSRLSSLPAPPCFNRSIIKRNLPGTSGKNSFSFFIFLFRRVTYPQFPRNRPFRPVMIAGDDRRHD